MIRNFFFWVFAVATVFIAYAAAFLASPFLGGERAFHSLAVYWAKACLRVGGVKIEVSGRENLPPEGSVIFASNHQSFMDVFAYLSAIDRPFAFVAMEQVFAVPVLNSYMRRAGYVEIHQQNFKQVFLAAKKLTDTLKAGRSIVIFPEGTRSPDGRLQEFKRGTAVLIMSADKPVVPVAIRGAAEIMRKDEFMVHPGRIKLNIGGPMKFDEFKEINNENALKITARLKETIACLMQK